MKTFLVAAALAVSSFALPTLPANAAPALTDEQANCLIFPMLKKECWEQGAAAARSVGQSVASTTEAVVEETRVPLWWNCKPAEPGTGHLLQC
jgi:hypothetical protein